MASPFRLEYRLRRHDGQYRWCVDSASPRLTASGELLGYIGSVVDITDRKQMEDALAGEKRVSSPPTSYRSCSIAFAR